MASSRAVQQPEMERKHSVTTWLHLTMPFSNRWAVFHVHLKQPELSVAFAGASYGKAPHVRGGVRAPVALLLHRDWQRPCPLAASWSTPRVVAARGQFLVAAGRYGCALDGTAAAAAAPDVDQQHVCVLFQEVLLRRLDDAPGRGGHPDVYSEKRRQRRRKHEVS